MASKSSYLPRLGFSRDGPILPLHTRTSPPIRKKPSEYDLADLSPRPDDALPSSDPVKGRRTSYSPRRSPSPSARFSDRVSNGASKPRPKQRILFAGPPPPIATSQMLYRDEEDRDTSASSTRHLGVSTFAQNINSVLFDRGSSSPSRARTRDHDHKPDAVWVNLQRRERALQTELQHLLDAQSAGLAANLDPSGAPPPPPSSTPSVASTTASDQGRSTTPTTTSTTTSSPPARRRRHVTFDQTPTATTASGTLVPVRQPRPKPLGLRAARAGLARTMALLADLKADEDAQLTAALGARKQALAQLRRWTARREGIAAELRALEEDDNHEDEEEEEEESSGGGGEGAGQHKSLGRELRRLEEERGAVDGEIATLEERLVGLRRRRKWLDGRVEEVRSRREAGLSGYRGALREVEGRIGGLLGRPGVRPLDGEFFVARVGAEDDGGAGPEETLGGVEFLRLRPERRTAEMAKEWWEGEVAVLERRKADVDVERAALEEGLEVWKGAVKLVSEFEAGLRREMRGGGEANSGKGKGRDGEPASPPSGPEHAMFAQLDKMRVVIDGLQERLHVAEDHGWNLLICAISAELEAFRQAAGMLREALRSAGFEVADDDNADGEPTPQLGRSVSMRDSSQRLDAAEPTGGGKLVDLHDAPAEDREPESDNEVPRDLLVATEEDEEHGFARPVLSREDSANEVPLEFLREHDHDGEYPGLEGMT